MGKEINIPRHGMTCISGVEMETLAILPTDGGPVLKMLFPASVIQPQPPGTYGEIYFSVVEPKKIKAWKRHMRQTQFFAVPCGMIKIALFDGRPDSPTNSMLFTTFLGLPDHYRLLRIPPGIWYGFANEGNSQAIICNCADLPHDPQEGEKLPFDTEKIPYSWRSS